MNEQELNKKLAEWQGWKVYQILGDELFIRWMTPEGKVDGSHPPDYTQSLDACFKWFPFPFDTLWIIRNPSKVQYCWGYARGEVNDVICWSKELPIEKCLSPITDHPALALCLAISKLIEDKDNPIPKEEI